MLLQPLFSASPLFTVDAKAICHAKFEKQFLRATDQRIYVTGRARKNASHVRGGCNLHGTVAPLIVERVVLD